MVAPCSDIVRRILSGACPFRKTGSHFSGTCAREATKHETKQQPHSHHPCRQPAAAGRSAGDDGRQREGRRARSEGLRAAPARGGCGDRQQAGRARHRRHRRRRIFEAELRDLYQPAAGRLRDRHDRQPHQPMVAVARSARVSGILQLARQCRTAAAAEHGLHRADHLQGPRPGQTRHREFQGRARQREAGRGVHAGDLAVERRGPAPERLLQDPRGIPVRHRRCIGRGIQGDRRRRFSHSDRRSAARVLLHAQART